MSDKEESPSVDKTVELSKEVTYTNDKPNKKVKDDKYYKDKLERLLREDVEKTSKPIWLTNLYVDRPCLMLAITMGFSLVISAITGATGGIALNE